MGTLRFGLERFLRPFFSVIFFLGLIAVNYGLAIGCIFLMVHRPCACSHDFFLQPISVGADLVDIPSVEKKFASDVTFEEKLDSLKTVDP